MNLPISPEANKISFTQRYEGLDAFRGFAAFGVVWLHTFLTTANSDIASTESIVWLKLRDFSLPLIVMSSFFVLTISMIRKSESKFSSFFVARFKRLWIPLFIWTSIYCLMWAFVIPIVFRWESYGKMPSADVFISGYMHLWFLQFIFLGSLIVYPLLMRLRNKSELQRTKISVLLFLSAFLYAFVFKSLVQNIQQSLITLKFSQSFVIFIVQSSKYVFFIPVAVGLGLLSNKINNFYKSNVIRICSLAAILLSLLAHLALKDNSLTAPAYGIAVFLAALQPWKRIPLRLVYIAAAYSYGTYILHFFLCEALQMSIGDGQHKFNSVAIFSVSLLFYVISLAAALVLRKILPVDWFIPLVPIEIRRSENKANL